MNINKQVINTLKASTKTTSVKKNNKLTSTAINEGKHYFRKNKEYKARTTDISYLTYITHVESV